MYKMGTSNYLLYKGQSIFSSHDIYNNCVHYIEFNEKKSNSSLIVL